MKKMIIVTMALVLNSFAAAMAATDTQQQAGKIRFLSTYDAEISSVSVLNLEGSREYFNRCGQLADSFNSILTYEKNNQYFIFSSSCTGEDTKWKNSVNVLSGKIKTNMSNTTITNFFCVGPNSGLAALARKVVRLLSTEALEISIQEVSDGRANICQDSEENIMFGVIIKLK